MAEQANIEAVLAENQRLRQSLVVMVTDRKKMASKLTAVQNLGLQLQKKEQQIKTLLEKNERLAGSLARAENRITQLPSGAQIGALVTPGVSKKVLEALTRDNTKLKQALEHLTNKGPAGVDLAVENQDLGEMCMTIRGIRDLTSDELSKLKIAPDAVQGQNTHALKSKVLPHVTKSHVDGNLNAKQNELQSLKDDRILRKISRELEKEQKRLLQRVKDTSNELRAISRDRDQKEGALNELKMEHELMQNALQEEKERLLQELRETTDKLCAMARDLDQKKGALNELKMEHELMQNALAGYENDFKTERQEKVRAMSDCDHVSHERDQLVQCCERLKQEGIGLWQLSQNPERMYAQAQAQQQQAKVACGHQTYGCTCASPVLELWQKQQAMRSRGFGMEASRHGFTDSPTSPPKQTPPLLPWHPSQGSHLQLHPHCRKSCPQGIVLHVLPMNLDWPTSFLFLTQSSLD
ncbi:uncharacterized protein LOC110049114 isoform X1 [Orbicella faveolata]|uniref:uncharacterized protein LOC110049114 isoform X1 n=1 Tax=Orbicella faveolata TaxID=48498 RepID=UPI0009E567DD|nr:uncharacterized protein LOC110049114 isoform X1 [Orbicella faveolata]